MNLGRLIVFEGPDGIGKSTILKQIAIKLEQCGRPVRQESFPGNEPGSLGALVYKLHHESSRHEVNEMSPLALQALHVAAHLDSIENRILPVLESGNIVLLDRFWWSTWVYGMAANVDEAALELLVQAEQVVWKGRLPDAVILITRSQPFRPEHPQKDFDRHLQFYLELVARESGHYPVFSVENNDLKCAVDTTLQILSGKLKPL
jgi:thymidylate kinase